MVSLELNWIIDDLLVNVIILWCDFGYEEQIYQMYIFFFCIWNLF